MITCKTDLAKKLLAITRTFFPRSCTLCLEPLDKGQQTLCTGCINDLPYNNNFCLRCAEPLVSIGLCPSCQKKPPNYRRCLTLCEYSYPISLAVRCIKKNPFSPESKQLSLLFARQLQKAYSPEDHPKIFIPMPIHPLKMLTRGFNQSQLIAHFLSSKLSKTQVRNNICRRKYFGKSQKYSSRQQRLKLLPTAFFVDHPSIIQGKSLALIDDVVTTGSTATAATASLLNAGAKSVDLWCIAKTSWHNDSGSIKI